MYTDLKTQKPEEGEKIWCGISAKPLQPKVAVYKEGKFYDASDDLKTELFPTHWKRPNVPFVF